MASTTELSLDCKPHSYSMLLKSFGDQPPAEHTQKLEEYLARLEEERLKIDAFKRELPLCMQLLASAVEASRQQLQAYRANRGARPFLEEFIPLKHAPSEASEKASNTSDKANWMTSAQLWSQASDELAKPQSTVTPTKENDIGFIVSPKLGLDNKQRNAGAFLPFSKDRKSCPIPELALNSGEKEMVEKKCSESIENGICGSRRESSSGKVAIEQGKGVGNSSEGQTTGTNSTASASAQTHRKARRCWSPELHRRFVNALQMLGGSQVATPKQIRELMKVEGLTNDEVKSHLQKFRLHTRRPSPSPQAAGPPAPQLVVLGGIWVPPEYAAATHNGGPTLYGAHPSSHASHFCAPPVPQEFYTPSPVAPPPHHQMHHHNLHHQLHLYNTASQQANSSPESDGRGAGDRSESIEDGKSDSSSWKGESGERKGLGALRDHEGEESNGSEITLKF